jgi:phosphate transport system permease protein
LPEIPGRPDDRTTGRPDDRFITKRSTLLVDRFMNGFIKVGGVGIIVAVFAIFVFILLQVLPLFRGAKVEPLTDLPVGGQAVLALGVDEWGELPVLLGSDGSLRFVPVGGGEPRTERIPLAAGEAVSAADYDQRRQVLALGTTDGRVVEVELNYTARLGPDGQQTVSASPAVAGELRLGEPGQRIVLLGVGEHAEGKLAAAVLERDGTRSIRAVAFTRQRSLMGGGGLSEGWSADLTPLLPGRIERLLVDENGAAIIAATADGSVHALAVDEAGARPLQTFRPFDDLADPRLASLDFLVGDVSLVATAMGGANRIFGLHVPPGGEGRRYGRTKDLPDLGAGADCFAASVRNKAFVVAAGREVSLRHGTSAAIRWQGTLPYPVGAAVLSGKYERLLLLDRDQRLHVLSVEDHHPEAGWNAFFGRVWYEGENAPAWAWQSSGASDDFEPQLSMVPLIFGTLKGTLYAMLFATPIALLAAIYCSEFMRPTLRSLVKPTIEIMASLPSVVLGFLAALWLAPLLETRVPSLLLAAIAVPATAMLAGGVWVRMPDRVRRLVPLGLEVVAVLPVLAAAGWIGWELGPIFERLAFAGDFRQWWPQATGASFEQRNSLIVGFMMGFAVIPIIFTIVDDALGNVPQSLRSGSLALGASRWQTAIRVVVPTASAGILSALMIGLGRAIGETMIVVMATGNTPIMDFDIFNGMRTLSANIAVELPEAPHGGTLYRTLFLGALLLFAMTFVINTLAEVLRQHLREKYKTV